MVIVMYSFNDEQNKNKGACTVLSLPLQLAEFN